MEKKNSVKENSVKEKKKLLAPGEREREGDSLSLFPFSTFTFPPRRRREEGERRRGRATCPPSRLLLSSSSLLPLLSSFFSSSSSSLFSGSGSGNSSPSAKSLPATAAATAGTLATSSVSRKGLLNLLAAVAPSGGGSVTSLGGDRGLVTRATRRLVVPGRPHLRARVRVHAVQGFQARRHVRRDPDDRWRSPRGRL